MYNHNKAQQSKNRVHISWDILYGRSNAENQLQNIVYPRDDPGFTPRWDETCVSYINALRIEYSGFEGL